MRFTPKTEKEIAESNLLAAGEYDFEVAKAEDAVSKSGNDMMTLELRVYDNEGTGRTIFDWLVDTDAAAYKTRHFAEAVDMLDEYERGELEAGDCVGRTGRCKVIIKKDKTGQYPDKNGVADYLRPKADAAQRRANGGHAKAAAPELDDDIPFVSCAPDDAVLLRKRDVL